MNRLLLFALLVFAGFFARGQSLSRVTDQSNPFLNDGNGRPLYLQTTNNVEGSPYFTETYKKADVFLDDGRVARNVKIKFDIARNQIQYVNENGVEMIPNLAVKGFMYVESVPNEISPVIFQKGFPAIGRQSMETYYQVLDTGKIKLLKSIKVNYRDDKPYGSPEITRIYDRNVTYYAYTPAGEMIRIEKDRDIFAEIFKAKQKQILAYINEKKLKLKSEEDYLAIFDYYRSLQD